MEIMINQGLLKKLQEQGIIKANDQADERNQAIISLIKTLYTLGYDDHEILGLLNKEASLLEILLFHFDLLQTKQNECCYMINQIKQKIAKIKE